MNTSEHELTRDDSKLFDRIVVILEDARTHVSRTVNSAMGIAYWMIGREIVEEEQKGKKRAEYGKALIEDLSRRLTARYGKGFSTTSLWDFRRFYQAYRDRCPQIPHPAGGEFADPCGSEVKSRQSTFQPAKQKSTVRVFMGNLAFYPPQCEALGRVNLLSCINAMSCRNTDIGNMMKILLFTTLCLGISATGCTTTQTTDATEQTQNIGWYTAMRMEHPTAMIDFGVHATLYMSEDGNRRLWAWQQKCSWQEFTNLNERCNPYGIDSGVYLNVTPSTPVGELKDVIRYLQSRGQNSILLFDLLECVDSPAMRERHKSKKSLEDTGDSAGYSE